MPKPLLFYRKYEDGTIEAMPEDEQDILAQKLLEQTESRLFYGEKHSDVKPVGILS